MAELLRTERIRVRDWAVEDADAALAIYGRPDVAHWLNPAMLRVENLGLPRFRLTRSR